MPTIICTLQSNNKTHVFSYYQNFIGSNWGPKTSYDEQVANAFSGGNVAVFIRSMIGIDRKAAMEKFSEFLSLNELNSLQQEYLNTILTYVSENGDITSSTIINDRPFDRFDWSVFGEHVGGVSKFVEAVHQVVSA